MEFASEMVIKAGKRRLRVSEVPIVYHPRVGESKLNSFRDAWRHVRFMLVHSPGFLFLLPAESRRSWASRRSVRSRCPGARARRQRPVRSWRAR